MSNIRLKLFIYVLRSEPNHVTVMFYNNHQRYTYELFRDTETQRPYVTMKTYGTMLSLNKIRGKCAYSMGGFTLLNETLSNMVNKTDTVALNAYLLGDNIVSNSHWYGKLDKYLKNAEIKEYEKPEEKFVWSTKPRRGSTSTTAYTSYPGIP
jgi:hypothetical protein